MLELRQQTEALSKKYGEEVAASRRINLSRTSAKSNWPRRWPGSPRRSPWTAPLECSTRWLCLCTNGSARWHVAGDRLAEAARHADDSLGITAAESAAHCGSIAAVCDVVLKPHADAWSLIGGEIAPVIFVEGFLLALLVGFAGGFYPAYWGQIFARSKPCGASRSAPTRRAAAS